MDNPKPAMVRPRAIMFHHFWNWRHPKGQGAIDADALRRMIEALGPSNILSPDEWRARVREGGLAAEDTCLTFDDGLRCQLDVAEPVLNEFGLRAFWFVYTGPLVGEPDRLEIYRLYRTVAFADMDRFYDAFFRAADDSMSVEERAKAGDDTVVRAHLPDYGFYTLADRRFRYIRDIILGPERYFAIMEAMMKRSDFDREDAARGLWIDRDDIARLAAAGHEFGLHSHTHPSVFAALSPAAQRAEFARNAEILSSFAGQAPRAAAYPCNSYTPETKRILADMGVDTAFRANLARAYGDPMEIPREDHADLAARIAKGTA